MKNYIIICLLAVLSMFTVQLHASGGCKSTCNQRNQQEVIYNFQTKKYEPAGKGYLNQRGSIAIKVININTNKYEVDGEIKENTFTTASDAMIKKLFPSMIAGDGNTVGAPAAPTANEDTVAKFNKGSRSKSTSLESLMNAYFAEYNIIQSRLDTFKLNLVNLLKLQQEDAMPDTNFVAALQFKKDDYSSLLIDINNHIDFGGRLKEELTLPEHAGNPFKAYYQSKIHKQDSLLNLVNLDSIYNLTNSLCRDLTNANNYNFYIQEFSTTADEIEPVLKYKLKGAPTFTERNLDKLKVAKFARLGFGAGPVAVFTPGLKTYYQQAIAGVDSLGSVDSITIKSSNARSKLSFALAAFVDLDYQFTPVVSAGIGVGSGVNVGETITGNLYAGLNIGFRLANKVQFAFRGGLAYTQQDVLKDKLNCNSYTSQEVGTDGITQKSWMPGGYFGVTISYLTNSITKK